jgi:hypothetical protein
MIRILMIVVAVAAGLHGLIHLMGFVAYWPLAQITDLLYKTSLLGGRFELGAGGMRAYSLLWLLASLGFVIAAVALAAGRSFWAPLMLSAALLSLVICILDWSVAFRGVWINLVFLLVLAVVYGFRIQPAPFQAYSATPGPVNTVPLPQGLPEPVERFYRQTYGDQVPVYHSPVISGRGTLRFMGVRMPARLRFVHQPDRGYRHYIETTFFGIPILKVNEQYLDGKSYFELPFGVIENEPTQNSAANQGLWAEIIAYPAVYVTDPRVRWEAVDDNTAKMYIPFEAEEQYLTVRFDPQTGLIARIETMRYRDIKGGKILWWGEMIGNHWEITWEDEGSPWLIADIEEIVLNSDVSDFVAQKGP